MLLVEHLALQLYLGLVESMVSEQSARLQAMDAAKTNIDERTAELTRAFTCGTQERSPKRCSRSPRAQGVVYDATLPAPWTDSLP